MIWVIPQERRLRVDWKKIKAEYIAGGTSYRKLAEKYSVSFGTLRKVAAKEKWTDLRNKAVAKADTKLVEEVSKNNAKIDDKYFNLVDKLLSKAEEVIEKTPVWQPQALKRWLPRLNTSRSARVSSLR